jgi:NADH-quinone oxidoreductase subunit N
MNCFYTLFSKLIIIILVLCVLIFSKNKIQSIISISCPIELPLIVAFCVLFLFLLTSSYDFFVTYLAIEGLSLTLYALAAMLSQSIISIEASFKYFALGAISSGILLFGISILFGLIGCLDFLEIQLFLGGIYTTNYFFEIKISLVLILFGFFFKISAFPCHI